MRQVVVVMLAIVALGATSARPQGKSDTAALRSPSSQEPTAEYSGMQPGDTVPRDLREKRNAQHQASGRAPISELPEGVEELPVINHWWLEVPAIPAAQSALIVIASVADSRAFLSADHTSVYSEFTLSVERTVRNCARSAEFSRGDRITAERAGGAVRFPSGRVQSYRIANQGFPKNNRRYVVFLKANEEGQDFIIITAYELRNGRVKPLDGESQLQFSKYSGTLEEDFLSEVERAAALPCEAS
ncbi:MAG TPA: hypothetical protein VNK82_03925 [Terriglobales bacterium]|nr:hypothetical protein [Terriglobales bacterium]